VLAPAATGWAAFGAWGRLFIHLHLRYRSWFGCKADNIKKFRGKAFANMDGLAGGNRLPNRCVYCNFSACLIGA
jgi:hypothetical protein